MKKFVTLKWILFSVLFAIVIVLATLMTITHGEGIGCGLMDPTGPMVQCWGIEGSDDFVAIWVGWRDTAIYGSNNGQRWGIPLPHGIIPRAERPRWEN